MMKTIIFFSIALLSLSTAQAQEPTKALRLSGELAHKNIEKVYLQKFDNKMFRTIDSSSVKNGKFKFNTAVTLPELYGLSLDTARTPLYVFLEDAPITVSLDSSSYYRPSRVKGSAANDLFVDYRKQRGVKIDSFIQQHPQSIVSAYALYRDFSYRLTPEEIQRNIGLLDPNLHKSPYVKVLQELVLVLQGVQIGSKAPDFSAQDPEGNTVKLSEHFGKYLLVDFWAAWCGPCRKENPHVVAAYKKFKDKGFEVFGISLDKNKESWIKAIKDDSLAWTQVSDLAFWNSAPAKLYGVRAIPSNFLIDPNGIIVARNLRGDALDKKLAELLK